VSKLRHRSDSGTKSKNGLRNVKNHLKQFFTWLFKEHWKELSAWVLSGGILLVHELWLNLIPIPSELVSRATLWWLFLSLVVIIMVAVHFASLRDQKSGKRRLLLVISMLLSFVLFAVVFPMLFYQVEWWWKQPEAPSDFIYNHLEPLVYGLIFAFFTAFLAYVVLLLADLLKNRPKTT
jgi:hypothetical protein